MKPYPKTQFEEDVIYNRSSYKDLRNNRKIIKLVKKRINKRFRKILKSIKEYEY